MWRLKQCKFVFPFPPTYKSLELCFLLFGVAVLPLCDSQAKGSHTPSETRESCQRNCPQSPLPGIHSSWVSHNTFGTDDVISYVTRYQICRERSTDPMSSLEGMTPAWSRFPCWVQRGPGTRAAPGISAGLDAAHSPHCQAAISLTC